MINVGQYAQPLDRTQFVETQLISGYTTARLRGQLQFNGSVMFTGTTPSLNDNLVRGLFVNTGDTAGTVQLMQLPDPAGSYRVNLGTPVVLQPGGRVTRDFTPIHDFVEVTCTGGGPTTVRIQLTSRISYQEMGFAKTETIFPQALWAPQTYYTANPASS